MLLPPFTEDPGTTSSPPCTSLVVAATDDLAGLHTAFDFALAKLARRGDSIYVLHAILQQPTEGAEEAAVGARKALVAAVSSWQAGSGAAVAPAVNVACDVVEIGPELNGAPDASTTGAEICRTAEELQARTVVLVHHGSTFQQEMLYGPITLHLTKFCSRPLVLLGTKAQPAAAAAAAAVA